MASVVGAANSSLDDVPVAAVTSFVAVILHSSLVESFIRSLPFSCFI